MMTAVVLEMLHAAVTAHRRGDLTEAVTGYASVLNEVCDQPDALHLMGVALHQQGKHDEAVVYVDKAATVSPEQGSFLFDAARVNAAAGRPDRALYWYTQVVRIDERRVDALLGLASSYRALGDFAAAAEACDRACRIEPHNFAAWCNHGLALRECGRLEEAVWSLRRALELDPGFVDGHLVVGRTLAALGREHEAIGAFRHVVHLDPERAEGWYELGNALRSGEHAREAIACFERAVALRPGYIEAGGNLGEVLQAAGRVNEAIEVYRGVLDEKPRNRVLISNLLFALNYPGGVSTEAIAEEHLCRGEAYAHGAMALTGGSGIRHDKRLRIGYVSPDLCEHSVAWFFEPILANHDRSRCAVHCYASVSRVDGRTERLRRMTERWRDIATVSDEDAARLIVNDGIEILVDLAGHTRGNRLGVFVQKPAPVQVTYLGYPNTTGLRAMDYRLTDAWADPPGAEKLCSEKIIRLPEGFLCFRPGGDAPEPRGSGRNDTDTVFGSFNNIAKLSDETVELWAAILKRTGRSRLLLKARLLGDAMVREWLTKRFVARGIDPSRLELLAAVPSPVEHLALYNRIDIALDTFPYNGTTTTCEALWMGVPVVTLAGDRHAARVGLSLLSQVGVGELVADSRERYVELAVELAREGGTKPYGPHLRRRMAESPLRDEQAFVRHLENAYEKIWIEECP